MKKEYTEVNLLKIAHGAVRSVVNAGDQVVDATIGNGHDTLFLAKCVGEKGRVIGFDIQEEALIATRERLRAASVCEDTYELYLTSHELMGAYVSSGVSAVMFNLGYLPGSDKKTITETENTLQALSHAVACLKPDGVISVMCYPGHDGGRAEANAVIDWVEKTEYALGDSTMYRKLAAKDSAPFLIIAEKLCLN